MNRLVALLSHWYEEEGIGADGIWSFGVQEKVGWTTFSEIHQTACWASAARRISLQPHQLIALVFARSMGPPIVNWIRHGSGFTVCYFCI